MSEENPQGLKGQAEKPAFFDLEVSDEFIGKIIDGIAPSYIREDPIARKMIAEMYRAALNVHRDEFFVLQSNYRAYSLTKLEEHLRATKHPTFAYDTEDTTKYILTEAWKAKKIVADATYKAWEADKNKWCKETGYYSKKKQGRHAKRLDKKMPKCPPLFTDAYPNPEVFINELRPEFQKRFEPYKHDAFCWVLQGFMCFMLDLHTDFLLKHPNFFSVKLNELEMLYFGNMSLKFWRTFCTHQRDHAHNEARNKLTETNETYLQALKDYCIVHGKRNYDLMHTPNWLGWWTPSEQFEQYLYATLNDGVQQYYKIRNKSEKIYNIRSEASYS